MPEAIDWAVDEIVELLKHAALAEILKDFGKGTGKHDPVVHFYETFLTAYDPKMRELRGVYYTPEAVVSYIVRSVDYLLKTRFGRSKGLADENTLILDPATGTATFLYFVIREIYEKFAGHRGAWDSYVASHLLNRVFGFELLMAPYAVAHLKLGVQLQETGYAFASGQRLGIYLTNTLEEAAKKSEQIFAKWISDEADSATQIKRDLPIMVVLGNPPYSGHSANRSEIEVHLKPGDTYSVVSGGPLPEQKVTKVVSVKKPKTIRRKTFIGNLIQDYYSVDGQPLGEKNPKWLQDDYVKFIRWGQWRIERTGAGILAFITNHGYLDNPTFRGMRQSLMTLFSEIYVLNLHGNSKKKETCPDGSPDKNVFDIQQGVTLGIFVKEPGKKGSANVFHADLWGPRESKYESLFETDVEATAWKEIRPQSPAYLFAPQSSDLLAEYEKGWEISEVFPLNSVGIVTARDNLAFGWSREQIWKTVQDFEALTPEDARRKYRLGDDAQDWKVSWAQDDIRASGPTRQRVVPCLYRPFDTRFTYYTGKASGFICRPRQEVMQHMLGGPNLAIITTGQTRDEWDALVTPNICGHKSCAAYDINTLFPLYTYTVSGEKEPRQAQLDAELSHWPAGKNGRRPNLNPDFIADMEKRLGLSFLPDGEGDLKRTFGPEDAFNYIYALFHSLTYRSRYAELLKSNLPRVPPTSDRSLFRSLCGLGAKLVALHLLESPKLAKPIARYPVAGPNVVEKGFPKYVAPGEPEPGTGAPLRAGRVYIDKSAVAPVYDRRSLPSEQSGARRAPLQQGGQYFEGIPPEVWNFHIGGYQVCEKWLKDRRGRTLTYGDLEHYCKVVTALSETIRLMAEIDAAIPKWPIT
jgi:predicted helicase